MSKATGTNAGWVKYADNPLIGGDLGSCFDIAVLQEDGRYQMYFSWRREKSIALVESQDGIHWTDPVIVIGPRATPEGWEDDLNRPAVVKRDGVYHMWYTGQFKPGQADGTSHLFYATSENGVDFKRVQTDPVVYPEVPWEKQAVMCPDVMWDEKEGLYKMWYSAGEQYEPTAMGYATSKDGIHWEKDAANPIFQADPSREWEQHKAAGCHVEKVDDWYVMFYIGYHDEHYAQIGLARSKDGVTDWQRHSQNPIIAPTPGEFDEEACYKPFALYDGEKWLLWYNGRRGHHEQIALVTHEGRDLGFDD